MTEYTLEQMKENRRLWVEALRSGEYKQGQGYLRSHDDHYCCLGVLCDLAGANWRPTDYVGTPVFEAEIGCFSHAPHFVRHHVGLRDSLGEMFCRDALSSLNDRGASFSEIADLIESNPPGLFIDSMEEAQ